MADLRERVPFPVRQLARHIIARVPHSIRYGAEFRRTRAFLSESQWWSRDRLAEYQLERLQALIRHVHHSVPYYRTLLDERGLRAEDFGSIGALRRLPTLTKDTIRNLSDRLVPEDIPRSQLTRVTTGGTTGMPMSVFWQRGVTAAREWAYIWRGWGWAGYHPGMRRVVLRGNVPRKRPGSPQPWWEYNPIDRQLILSTFQMNTGTLGDYVDRIERFRPHAIQAYPSALLPLTTYLKERGGSIEGLRCVLTCSETVRSGQRALTEEVLGCRIQDHYGTTEGSALVMQCEKSRYHVIPEYGIIELIGEDGEPVEAGSAGEMVVTGFINPAMPLIRYRTGDVAVRGSSECPCGRNYEVLDRIEGRIQEYLVDRNGSLASAIWSDGPLWNLPDRVECYQYVQNAPGLVILNVEARGGLTDASIARIRRQFEKHYPRVALEIREVDHIPRTESGKFRYVVQHLPLADAEFGAHA